MGLDSPVGSAEVNVLVVAAGNVTQSRFRGFLTRLQGANIVRLGDVSPGKDSSRNSFNPAAFPSGSIIFNLSDPASRVKGIESYPFELNREPQVVLAVADGQRSVHDRTAEGDLSQTNGVTEARLQSLREDLRQATNAFPRALISHLLVFDSETVSQSQQDESISYVPPLSKSHSTTMKTVMCDVAGMFLSELHEVLREIQELPAIDCPWKHSSLHPDGPSSVAARVQHRMTMPARSASVKEGQELRLGMQLSPTSSHTNSISRSATPNGVRPSSQIVSREPSRDRASTPVQGSNPSLDRNQSKLAGRAAIAAGTLYLQAGRWPDALKELEHGLTICRSMSDYLWHGRALELIIACLLMLSWANIAFQIPQVCYPVTDKSSSKSVASSSSHANQGLSDVSGSITNLTKLLPELCSTILTLYNRAANFTQERLPQILLFESNLRLISMLSAIHVRGGVLDRVALNYFVTGQELSSQAKENGSSNGLLIHKQDLSAMFNQAINMEPEQLTPDEAIYVLIVLASRFSILDLRRKKAFFIRELIAIIIPSLVHARKVGAAEMGIHPAAGLSALLTSSVSVNDSSTKNQADRAGLRPLLKAMMDMYAIFEPNDDNSGNGSEYLISRRKLDSIGDGALKIDVLKACVNICEALPDLEGIIRFNVQLLHAAKGTLLMPEAHITGGPLISQEEQTRILTGIQRTVGAASRAGLENLEADYWDDFLLRDIERLEPDASTKMRSHTKRELDLVGANGDAKPKDPFIFNPFAKASAETKKDSTLVAGEPAYFRVTFQNVFDFDIEVDLLSLEAEGCDFTPVEQSLLIGPYCLQTIVMSGTPKTAGHLEVKGVTAHIRGCRRRVFPIWRSKARPHRVQKVKGLGLKALDVPVGRPLSSDSTAAAKKSPWQAEDSVMRMTVIEPQPIVAVKRPSPSQFAVMVIEGETKGIEITLQNVSKKTPVDFILFSFQDSATTQVQQALSNKELNPADLYDLQSMLLEKPGLRLKSELNASSSNIAPGSTATFYVEITGKPGLLDGAIQIDYAFLGKRKSEVGQRFFTRQLTVPVTVTVNAGLELMRCNILPFTGDFAWSNQQANLGKSGSSDKIDNLSPSPASSKASSLVERKSRNQFTSLLSRLGVGNYGDDHCLVLLDLRNGWPHPLTINIQVREHVTKTASSSDPWSRAYGVHETIQPGFTSRSVLLLPRFFLSNPHEPIPTIGNSRQFVVSTSKLSPELELASREAFWFREELIKHLRGSWTEDATGRKGSIDLRRAIRLNPRMIEAMRIQDVEISMRVEAMNREEQTSSSVEQLSRCHFALRTDEFATLYVSIRNRSTKPLFAMLRLQPSLRDQPYTVALDLTKRFAWTGMLQRTLHPPIKAGETREEQLGITALCEGMYEIGASVEEMTVNATPSEMLIGLPPGRRIWHSREPCMIDATEDDVV